MMTMTTPPPMELTPDELQYLAAYRAMDDETRSSVLKVTKTWAVKFPRRQVPALRLIEGGQS